MPINAEGKFFLSRAYGSNDVRGLLGEELQEIDALRLGRAFGRFLEMRQLEKIVAVGGDVRLSTLQLKETLIQGLLQSGCLVLDVGILPTPALYFAKGELKAPSAIMVTASHNPPDHNGFKPEVGDLPTVGDELAELWQLVLADACGSGQGIVKTLNILPAYAAHIQSFFPAENHLRLVLDCGNGSMGLVAPSLFAQLGFDVINLFSEPDGRFPNRAPDTVRPEYLSALAQTVVAQRADLGIAFDGDGDRMGFTDEKGRVIDPDRAFLVFVHDVLTRKKGAVVYDLKCSNTIPEAIERLGGTPIMEKTGHGFIKYAFILRKAVLAGELTGHFSFDEIGRDDGLFAALRLTQIVKALVKPLSAYIDDFPRYCTTPDLRLEVSPAEIADILQAVRQKFVGQFAVSELDGIRVDFKQGWGLARASINSPEMTLRFEGKTERDLYEILLQFVNLHPLITSPIQAVMHKNSS